MYQVMLHDEDVASVLMLLLVLWLLVQVLGSGSQRKLTGTPWSKCEMLRLISGRTRRGFATINSVQCSNSYLLQSCTRNNSAPSRDSFDCIADAIFEQNMS